MSISEWLKESTDALSDVAISTSRLDCLVLLADSIGKDKSWVLAHPEYELQIEQVEKLNAQITRRTLHIPLAYIRGHAEFYGREFAVNEHTLVPRPETETLIELLEALPLQPETTILDVGTGSGCIAITAALELPNVKVLACDIDVDTLKTAKQNADNLHASVEFFESNLLGAAPSCNIIATNLPYVPDNFQINTAATHEPRHALFGGEDGLDLYRTLFTSLLDLSSAPQYILTEALPSQHKSLATIAKAAGYSLEKTDDFIQLFQRD